MLVRWLGKAECTPLCCSAKVLIKTGGVLQGPLQCETICATGPGASQWDCYSFVPGFVLNQLAKPSSASPAVDAGVPKLQAR